MASADNGQTWIENLTQFNLPSYADINKITFTSGSASRAFVSTPDNGIYSNAISELPPVLGLKNQADIFSSSIFNIFPNPNSGIFKLSFTENVEEMSVLNQEGKEIQTLNTLSDQTVNLNLPSGLYFLKAHTSNGVAMKKLIIK